MAEGNEKSYALNKNEFALYEMLRDWACQNVVILYTHGFSRFIADCEKQGARFNEDHNLGVHEGLINNVMVVKIVNWAWSWMTPERYERFMKTRKVFVSRTLAEKQADLKTVYDPEKTTLKEACKIAGISVSTGKMLWERIQKNVNH